MLAKIIKIFAIKEEKNIGHALNFAAIKVVIMNVFFKKILIIIHY